MTPPSAAPTARSATSSSRPASRGARRATPATRYHTELRVLALHGLLHLLGYDHEAPDDGGRMRRTEERLRRKGGLESGLIGRART